MRYASLVSFLTFVILGLMLSQISAIPTQYTAPDVSGDVELLDGNYGTYSEGDTLSLGEVDITQLDYDFDGTTDQLALTMTLAGMPVLNATMTYSITVSIDRYEGSTSPLEEASFGAAYLGGGSSGSLVYLYDNGTTNTENPSVNHTLSSNTVSWTLDLSNYPAVDEIFVANTTSVTLQGYSEFYPDALTGSTNARFYDEARLEWPLVADDTSDEDKNSPVPFQIIGVVVIPIIGLFRRKQV